jgi:hypothetical protein
MRLYDCIEVIVCCKCVSCAINTMKYMLAVLNVLFIILGAVVISIGAFLIKDPTLNDTYGSTVTDAGIGLMVIGCFTILMAIIGCIGAKQYNKRALVIYMVLTFIIMCFQLYFGLEAYELAAGGGIYSLCVKRGTNSTSTDVIGPAGTNLDVDCSTFAENSLRVGSYALWQNLWNDAERYRCCRRFWADGKAPPLVADWAALKDPTSAEYRNCPSTQNMDPNTCNAEVATYEKAFKLLAKIQEQGKCCGFGKPYSVKDLAKTPSPVDPINPFGCVPSLKTDGFLKSTGKSIQRCYGYDTTDKEGPTYTNLRRSEDKGLYCNWIPDKQGPTSTCGLAATDTTPNFDSANRFEYPQLQYQEYDFPVGTCPELCYPYGCAQVIFSYVATRLAGFSLVILLLIVVNTLGFFSACCLAVSHKDRIRRRGGKEQEMKKLNDSSAV